MHNVQHRHNSVCTVDCSPPSLSNKKLQEDVVNIASRSKVHSSQSGIVKQVDLVRCNNMLIYYWFFSLFLPTILLFVRIIAAATNIINDSNTPIKKIQKRMSGHRDVFFRYLIKVIWATALTFTVETFRNYSG